MKRYKTTIDIERGHTLVPLFILKGDNMSKWCVNKLILASDNPTKIQEVFEFIQKEKDNDDNEVKGIGSIDFNKIVPEPAYENNDDWCNRFADHRGAKWNASNCQYDAVNNSIKFDTAWSPPRPIIQAMSEKFPDVIFTLKYAEPGVWFAGVCEFENGEMVVDDSYDVSEHSDDHASKIFKELLGFDMLNPEDETEIERGPENKGSVLIKEQNYVRQ